jgi:DNA-binding NarL/FixJ family response regulator
VASGAVTDDRRLRVLVVDDEPDVRLLLEIQLKVLGGFEVVGSAKDGGEAIELVRTSQPEAVVMDLLMPGVNGFQAIDTLQKEWPRTGIVAYTGVAGDFVRQEMARRGIEVVLKSGDVEPLADALRRSVASLIGEEKPG